MENNKLIECLFENSDSAIGLHKIIVDEKENPIDYIFEKVNPKFEEYTGLIGKEIIGKKVSVVLPGILNSNFDWISTYGEVALTGKSISFEAFSEQLNSTYSVKAFSPEKYYFITLFDEINDKKSKKLLNKIKLKNEELILLNKTILELSSLRNTDALFNYLVDTLSEIVPDSIIIGLATTSDEYNLLFKSISGLKKNLIKKAIDFIGYDVYGKKFKIIPEFIDIYKQNKLYQFNDGLYEFSKSELSEVTAKGLQKLLGIKSIYTIGLVFQNRILGNVHIFSKNEKEIKSELIENLCYQTSIFIDRLKEYEKKNELMKNFQLFYNTLKDFVFVIDKNGKIIYSNEYAKEHLNYSFDELNGKSITSLCKEKDIDDFKKIINIVLNNQLITNECTFRAKTGEEIPIQVQLYSGIWDEDEIVYLIGKDLTEVKKSETKFITAFHHNPSPMSISELKTGIFIDVNDAFLEALKCSREDITGKSSLELNIFNDVNDREKIIEQVKKQKNVKNYKLEYRTFKNEIKTCLLSSEIISINNEDNLLTTYIDISDRIKMENQINAMNQTLINENKLFQNGPVVLLSWENQEAYPIGFISENVRELIGFNDKEINEQGISFLDIIHYLDREKVINEMTEAISNTEQEYINHSDFRINTKDERLTWVNLFTMLIRDDSGAVSGFLGYIYDITNTKNSEENLQILLKNYEWKNKELESTAHRLELQINERTLIEKMLRESEEKFRSLSESAKDGIIIIDSKGEVTYWNQAATEIFGYLSDEMYGKELHRVITSRNAYEEHSIKMKQFVKNGTGPLIGKTIELPAIHKSGKTITVELSLSAVQLFGEWNAIGIFRDISERKKQEQKLADLNDELTLSNIEKDKFFSIIGHDLKGPLGGLIGLSELMAEDIESIEKEELVEIAQNFNASLVNIHKLLENLLDWSRLQRNTIQFNPEMMNLKLLSQNTSMILKAALSNKKINFINNIPDDAVAYADENMISTVLRNLINNSIKFTNPEGTITLYATDTDDDKIKITVEDTGIGMDAEHQKNLFQIGKNFSRLGTENEQGTGLGLILCKEFINKNGGEIWVESKEGHGTKFLFTLPKKS